MNARKIEMNINEITNVDKKKEESKESSEIDMSTAPRNRIVAKQIHVTQAVAVAAAAAEVQEVPECKICFEKYNKSNHMPIKCTSCDFEACRQCHSTFILDTTNAIPNCMNCHKELQREFLVENFTQKFVTQDWKKHREQIIFQRERALLPTRQPVAEMVRRKEALKSQNEELLKQMNELRAKQYQCQREIGNIDYRIRMGPAADANPNPRNSGSAPHAAAFIRPCPNTASNCRGFLSTQWKCNLCNMWACKDCHEIKGAAHDTPHECNPDNLASAKLIDAETRPCPKCGARVFKISGCNQMFCTACNDCAFDWVTGRIETIIHNPHYFEFQRQRNGGQAPRVLGDILCGREVDHATIHTITMDLFPREEISRMIILWRNTNRDMYGNITITAQKRWEKFYDDCIKNVGRILWATNTTTATGTGAGEVAIRANTQKMNCYRQILFRKIQFREICRLIIEIRQVTLPQHRVDPLRYNEELGVKYLLGELSEKDFATALQRSDKKMQKSRDIQNILTMVLNTSTDIIFRFAEHLRTSRALIFQNPNYVFNNDDFTTMDEIRELFRYANTCFERVSKNYQSTTSLKIGTSLEPNYWEDNGQVIYQFMASR